MFKVWFKTHCNASSYIITISAEQLGMSRNKKTIFLWKQLCDDQK